jgi:phosphoglycolate phosphatase-like HAD superfamily hydrolase
MPICFDLDGTLGTFDGGFHLLRAALGDLWQREPTVEDLGRCHGSTDWEIVGQLHQLRFGQRLTEAGYHAYDRACLARFSAEFSPGGRAPEVFRGLVAGLTHLLEAGHPVTLVSGNAPSVLEFKARALGVDARIPRLGSLPQLDRTGLIRRAIQAGPGPHLYVGDRPHDLEAARSAGVPFIGVGARVPGDHPILSVASDPVHLVQAVQQLLAATSGPGPSGPRSPLP